MPRRAIEAESYGRWIRKQYEPRISTHRSFRSDRDVRRRDILHHKGLKSESFSRRGTARGSKFYGMDFFIRRDPDGKKNLDLTADI